MVEEYFQKKCELNDDGFFKWCTAMHLFLDREANAQVKGLVQVNLFSFKTGQERCVGVCYRNSHKKDARKVMLNVCPWCGEKILNEKAPTTKQSEQ